MPRELTLDIETVDSFADVGKYDPTLLHVSLIGVHDSGLGLHRSYLCEYRRDDKDQWERDADGRMKLTAVKACDYELVADGAHGQFKEKNGGWRAVDGLAELWQLMQAADRVIGYNILNFDYGVLDRYYPGGIYQSVKDRREQRPRFETLDLMVELEKPLGFRAKLDDVAAATLGFGKTGHGLQAIEFYRKGEIAKLSDYCLHDVKVTYEVYLAGLEHGRVKIKDRMGQLREAEVGWRLEKTAPVAMTMF
jgi:hypothetical protein